MTADEGLTEDARPPAGGRRVLVFVVATVVVLFMGAAIGMLIGVAREDAPTIPGADSVDVGFAQDMRVHHFQAITMAGIERDRTTDPALHSLAFDIESTQLSQAGEMDGWLTVWEQPELPDIGRAPMSWMGGAGHAHGTTTVGANVTTMPGMATTEELNKLRGMAPGAEADIYFLQLMLRHHEGAVPMAQYAAEHASMGYVRDLAGKMISGQTAEVNLMTQMLAERGARPLPVN
ncbi:MAG TPA: DUF305 domain-containing protein [Actinophytocola sp.]|uniref:DUF305 domain-containing protein n=1 Tax=Actinophytocola sp. TaxID=1872138 RepID=UPI002DBF16BE|nr:DUF305 domain-containing protein [Actinophytocola sp.]HEU5470001.1 DUF305 domain-containing protein [Actinophytocola sp.]